MNKDNDLMILTFFTLFCIAYMVSLISIIPFINSNDDGSSKRHLLSSSLIACASSSFIPFSGYYVATSLGNMYEGNSVSSDTIQDLRLNEIGAKLGSRYGNIAFVVWMIILLVTKHKRY